MSDLASTRVAAWPGPDWRVVAPALVLLLGGGAYVAEAVAWRQAALYLLGGALWIVLYHAAFGLMGY